MRLSVVVLQRINILTIVHLYNMLLISWTLQDAQKVRDTVIFLLQLLRFAFSLKKSVLNHTKKTEFLRVLVDLTSTT